MFCTTLRHRASLASLLPHLTSPSTTPRLREKPLQTHDLALPASLPSTHRATHSNGNSSSTSQPHHLFLLLTPTGLTPKTNAETETGDQDLKDRFTRFSTLTSTPTPTIVFLAVGAHNNDNNNNNNNMHAFLTLQTMLFDLPTPPPLLYVREAGNLIPLLRKYVATCASSSSTSSNSAHEDPAAPVSGSVLSLDLLRRVTTSAPSRPLTTHAANVLSDLCHSLRDVAALARTEQGSAVLRDYLGEEGRGVVEFWEGEWYVD